MATALLLLAAGTRMAFADPPAAKPEGSAGILRLADGNPNLQGLWIINRPTPQVEGSENIPITGGLPRFGGDPPPYLPWAAEQVKQLAADINRNDPQVRCLLQGVPRIQQWPWPFEIVQTQTRVVILYEQDLFAATAAFVVEPRAISGRMARAFRRRSGCPSAISSHGTALRAESDLS